MIKIVKNTFWLFSDIKGILRGQTNLPMQNGIDRKTHEILFFIFCAGRHMMQSPGGELFICSK
jgi:hypothetical protein